MPFWQAYDGRFGDVVVGHTPGPGVRRLGIDRADRHRGLLRRPAHRLLPRDWADASASRVCRRSSGPLTPLVWLRPGLRPADPPVPPLLTIYRSNRAELLAQLLATQLLLHPARSLRAGAGDGQHLAHQPLAGGTAGHPPGRHRRQRALPLSRRPAAADRRPGAGSHRIGQRRFQPSEARARGAGAAAGPQAQAPQPGGRRSRSLARQPAGLAPAGTSARDRRPCPKGTPLRRWLLDRDLSRSLDIGQLAAGARHRRCLRRLRPLPPRPAAGLGGRRGDRRRRTGRCRRAQRGNPCSTAPCASGWSANPSGCGSRSPSGGCATRIWPRRSPGGTPLRLFGLSSMAPVQVQLLQALTGIVAVELFLLTPCRDLWQRCAGAAASAQRCPGPASPRCGLVAGGAGAGGALWPAGGGIPAAAGGHRRGPAGGGAGDRTSSSLPPPPAPAARQPRRCWPSCRSSWPTPAGPGR